ncbi:hypothetical protein C8E87_8257 [Paractinoplanes brasiliensis]|uniref:Uncharacterized protein n=1 Tax=Paractinoplanes brasiliensis TaxID=52695 RepID=A0A4R6JE16_9ACTN|nr:hypothetical protein C8E87_8257 [Actinoplanes brasiliensis]GID31671.1 hypothetical protein Abr02nite_66540 [Actinoplanes brasiliensis]
MRRKLIGGGPCSDAMASAPPLTSDDDEEARNRWRRLLAVVLRLVLLETPFGKQPLVIGT